MKEKVYKTTNTGDGITGDYIKKFISNKNISKQAEEFIDVSSKILDIEALQNISGNAKEEEIYNLKDNIESLTNERDNLVIPYPDVGLYDIGSDYDEIADLQSKKRSNKYYWDKIDEINSYLDTESLYSGHLSLTNGSEFYFVDGYLSSRLLKNNNVLISVNDAAYNEIFKKWKFPKKDDDIRFSRNIDIKNKTVKDVTIIYDDGNDVFSSISDLFLRNVLIKNKSNGFIQSIIQTIQEKQNEIRIFDGNKSVVVQGCAGSGKTMVLLHRFKYLKYNGVVNGNNYALLVPGENFKGFVKSTAKEFGLYEDNVFTFTEYYRYLLNINDKKWSEANELNFNDKFLSTVYSENFIRKNYLRLIEFSNKTINEVIDFCKETLSNLIDEKNGEIMEDINIIKNDTMKKISLFIKKIPFSINGVLVDKYDDLPKAIERIKKFYCDKENEIKQKTFELSNSVIPESLVETTEKSNLELVLIRKEILDETAKYEKASVFTKVAHKFKLNSLKAKYDEKKKEVIDKLLAEYKKETPDKITTLKMIDGKINIAVLKDMIRLIEKEYASSEKQINDYMTQTTNYDAILSNEYANEIKEIKELIKISSEAPIYYSESVNELKHCPNLVSNMKFAARIAKMFNSYKCKSKITKSDTVNFIIMHESDMYKTLLDMAFKLAKDDIKDKFNITLCKRYKHSWFIQLYFAYLLNGIGMKYKDYLFIDEAQDLSPAEINLLQKVNTVKNGSVCDLFGDVKQVISNYGVKDWKQFDFVDKFFELDENFRNTNQIINYCAEKLHFSMKPVGVSMDKVKEFSSFDEMIESNVSYKVFVVKDEYAAKVLETLLKNAGILGYSIFTVRDVKGLEFKQIIVFDEEMTSNEKYISYTRALIQLYVVKRSPWNGKKRIPDIIEEDEE